MYLKFSIVTTNFLINITQNTTNAILRILYDLYSILPLHRFQEGDGDGASFDEDDVSTKYSFFIIKSVYNTNAIIKHKYRIQ